MLFRIVFALHGGYKLSENIFVMFLLFIMAWGVSVYL